MFGLSNAQAAATLAAVLVGYNIILPNGERLLNEDVLNGTVSPSGKLPDTIARTPADYPAADHYGADDRNFYAEDIYVGYRYFETFAPEKVLYPFGFGLSYTKFEVQLLSADENADGITAVATVKNIGARPGKEVVQLYCTAPQGLLGKPAKVLCAFAKTKTLAPGESQTLMLTAPWRNFASYDDSGATGHKSAFVLEAGDYIFSLGTDVRHAAENFTVTLPLMVVEQQESAAAPAAAFERLRHHDLTPAAAIRIVVDLLLAVFGIVADLVAADIEQAARLRPAEDALAEHGAHRVGKERENVDAHALTSLRSGARPCARRRGRCCARTPAGRG